MQCNLHYERKVYYIQSVYTLSMLLPLHACNRYLVLQYKLVPNQAVWKSISQSISHSSMMHLSILTPRGGGVLGGRIPPRENIDRCMNSQSVMIKGRQNTILSVFKENKHKVTKFVCWSVGPQ